MSALPRLHERSPVAQVRQRAHVLPVEAGMVDQVAAVEALGEPDGLL
jgi:hypothetical protein